MRKLGLWLVLASTLSFGAACGSSSSSPLPEPQAPIADAGRDQSVSTGAVVTLDGSGSTDPEGQPITYEWTFLSTPAQSRAALSSATAPRPTFSADRAGTYEVELVVSDGELSSAADRVVITATDSNHAPTANAGPDQSVAVGAIVNLDGSGSGDADGDPITYVWSITSRPAGSIAGIQDPYSPTTLFVADVAGTYTVELLVGDGTDLSTPDPMVVTATAANGVPVANAGADQAVQTGATVTLNGGASNDPEGDPLTFQWSLLSRPDGSAAAISDAAAVTPQFVADVDGDYVVQLVVSDGLSASVPDTVVISASAVPVPTVPSMSGTWTGTANVLNTDASVRLDVSEAADGRLSGDATFDLGKLGKFSGAVNGVHDHPDVHLTAQIDKYQGTYDGTFSGNDTIKGTVDVAGIASASLTLYRQ